jgi:iron complex transport system ATP-binding protein
MTASTELVASGLSVRLGGATIISGIDVTLAPGRITALVGPNGSGKSTLLRAFSRILRPAGGTVVLDGEDIAQLPTRAVARRLALLPQRTETMTGVTVAALVGLGRQPHLGRFGGLGASDREAIAWALEVTDARGIPTGWSTRCPAASASAPGWRWRWPSGRACCCSTSPRPTSTCATSWRS